jgi:hypothetical protein
MRALSLVRGDLLAVRTEWRQLSGVLGRFDGPANYRRAMLDCSCIPPINIDKPAAQWCAGGGLNRLLRIGEDVYGANRRTNRIGRYFLRHV